MWWCRLMQAHKLILEISHDTENVGENCELETHNLFCRHPDWIIGQIDGQTSWLFSLSSLAHQRKVLVLYGPLLYNFQHFPHKMSFLWRKRPGKLLSCSCKQVLQFLSFIQLWLSLISKCRWPVYAAAGKAAPPMENGQRWSSSTSPLERGDASH